MKDLLDKIGSYNIFNYLLPGVLFAVFLDRFTSAKALQMDIAVGVFVYYFLGAVVSRIGSLLLEPLLRRLRIVTFAPYADFARAEKHDAKLEVLSETNNMYRTLAALLLSISVVALYEMASEHWPLLRTAAPTVVVSGLFALFLVAYRKQTEYIRKRIAADLREGHR